jgi:hypothetical protein
MTAIVGLLVAVVAGLVFISHAVAAMLAGRNIDERIPTGSRIE